MFFHAAVVMINFIIHNTSDCNGRFGHGQQPLPYLWSCWLSWQSLNCMNRHSRHYIHIQLQLILHILLFMHFAIKEARFFWFRFFFLNAVPSSSQHSLIFTASRANKNREKNKAIFAQGPSTPFLPLFFFFISFHTHTF